MITSLIFSNIVMSSAIRLNQASFGTASRTPVSVLSEDKWSGEAKLMATGVDGQLRAGGAMFDPAYRIEDTDQRAYAAHSSDMSDKEGRNCTMAIQFRMSTPGCGLKQTYGGEACKLRYTIPDYRLADFVAGRAAARGYVMSMFPNSLAVKYWHSTKRWDGDYNALYKLTNQDKLVDKPHQDTVVVHYRGYDVLAWSAGNGIYSKNMSFYEDAAKRAAAMGLKKAVIMAGDHHGMVPKWKRATQVELDKIQEIFEKHRFAVTQRVDGNPDCDFIFGANSKFFVPGGGGFSKLISAMVTINNGTVVNPTFGKPIAAKIKATQQELQNENYKPNQN